MQENLIKKILLEEGYVSKEDIKLAEDSKENLVDFLFKQKILTKEIFGQALAEHYGVKFINLNNIKIDTAVLKIIPEVVAASREIILFEKSEDFLKAGMLNPTDIEIIHSIEKKTGQKIKPYFITPQDLEQALMLYKNSMREEFDKIVKSFEDKSLKREDRDDLVVKMVYLLLEYGSQNKASDIHIEPYREKIVIRFRIDGMMHQVLELPKDLQDLVVARIKILAKIRTDEQRAAQDGKLQFEIKGEYVDVRVSVVPVVEGENVVMRLLSSKNQQFGLTDLGFGMQNLKIVEASIKNPHGMILVTGPTGSGKTTTLYAVLKILNKPNVHVSTIEDPVEYDIEGVSQIQVNPKTNLTFAKGLRAIVRQDPDIIMIGEIRDRETAGIAINSALTGHLVLSTLHTNDAATTLPRLIDMGIEPFLVASTVNIIVAQRLARKICEKCRVSYQLSAEEIKIIKNDSNLTEFFKAKKGTKLKDISFYKGTGCEVCGQTGYLGRIGIFEVLKMTEEIKQAVVDRLSSDEIIKEARKQGMQSLLEDGLEKVLNGITTLEEVIRIAREQ